VTKKLWKRNLNDLSKLEKSFISLIFFASFFTFNLDFPSLRFSPLLLYFGLLPFPNFLHFFTDSGLVIYVVVPSKKELLPNKTFWLDVEYFGSHTVRYCEDGFYEIVGV